MNITNSELRAKARAALGGNIFAKNWLMALLVALIVDAISGVVGSIPAIGTVGSIIIAGPLAVGLAFVFLTTVRHGSDVNIEDAFSGFSDFAGNLLLGLMYTIFIFLWSLLLVIPGIVKSYSYAMCFYIKNDHPEYDWKQCITESRRMIDGNKWRLFCLHFSFIGWIFVGVITIVGVLWVVPYMEAAQAAFYNELKGEEPVAAEEPATAEEPAQVEAPEAAE